MGQRLLEELDSSLMVTAQHTRDSPRFSGLLVSFHGLTPVLPEGVSSSRAG